MAEIRTAKQIEQDKIDKAMNGVALWASFYRANPHRFCEDYLNIHLKIFQQILLYMMNISYYFMYIAARGSGKTFLVAIFCVVRCILYPGTIVCVSSKTRGQANEVLEKITTILIPNSANLKMEIKDFKVNLQDGFIEFKNTSVIKVVTATDNSRHNRANIVIVDEFRMVPESIITTVLRKFLTAPRHPGYLDKPEYAHLIERNKEIYMSSAWFSSHWSYNKFQAYCANLVNDVKRYFVCGLPYQLSIRENLLSKDQVADEMSEADFNEMSWRMEMEALWWTDTDGSFFTYSDVSDNRQIKYPAYPTYTTELFPQNKFKIPDLVSRERRILSVDVALLASKKQNNDAASIYINSALQTSSGRYVGNLIYAENHEGLVTQDLALKVRRLYEMYHCTDIALDVKGVGIGVFDALIREIYDPEFGVTYSPLNCCNDSTYAERCSDKNAPKVIWALQGTAQFNNDIYIALRDGFKQHRINLLLPETEFAELFSGIKGFEKLEPEIQMKFKLPYIETTLAIMELINLEYEAKGNLIRVHEKPNMRKDRVSSIAYNYYVQQQLERKQKNRTEETVSFLDIVQVKKPILFKGGE